MGKGLLLLCTCVSVWQAALSLLYQKDSALAFSAQCETIGLQEYPHEHEEEWKKCQ